MNPSEVTPAHIATAMRFHSEEIWDLAREAHLHFKPPRMQPVGKKHRLLDVPKPFMKMLLKLLHRFCQKQLPIHPCVHGGVLSRSCFSAARHHCGRYAVITRDIKDCYPTVTSEAFQAALRQLGFRADTAHLLTQLMTIRGRIPQGSPVSGDALNLFLYAADERIRVECSKFGGRYTRSADDMVISVEGRFAVRRAEALLEEEIRRAGLKVNAKKRDENGVKRRHQVQLVHNISVNSPRGTRVSDEREKNALDAAEAYVRGARGVGPCTIIGLAARRERVFGHYHDLHQAERSPGSHILRLLDAGDRLISDKLRRIQLSSPKNRWWMMTPRHNEPLRLSRLWPKQNCAR